MSDAAWTPEKSDTLKKRERRIVAACVLVVFGMVGMAYAAVPLYDLFCRVTGYGGTTQVAEEGASTVLDREMTVRFDANISRDLPWLFRPVHGPVEIRIGEQTLVFFEAVNTTERELVGTATFNVTPQKAGSYFNKLECFCFTEQVLAPGERVEMPVSFFIDPAIAEDPEMDDVTTMTLSYTFFPKTGSDGN